MTRRRMAVNGDSRGRNGGRVVRSGKGVVAPPALLPGQFRCPVCRNGVSLTLRGYLRSHVDLYGHLCSNRTPPDAAPILPDVAPDLPPVRIVAGTSLPPTGRCHDCGQRVTGERRFCGPCFTNH